MGNRRFAQIATSDDEDDGVARQASEEAAPARKRRLKRVAEESEEEVEEERRRRSRKKTKRDETASSEGEEEEDDEEEEEEELEAKPIGKMVKISGKGRTRRHHYKAFEYDGNQYELVCASNFGLFRVLIVQFRVEKLENCSVSCTMNFNCVVSVDFGFSVVC